jgi:glycosyltransferase involved in cell wall biosynthesis
MVSSDLNFPPIYGGRIRRYNLMKQLSKDHQLSLLCFTETEEDIKNVEAIKPYCQKVITIPKAVNSKMNLKEHITRFILRYILQCPPVLLSYRSGEMKSRLYTLLKDNSFDVILFEYWYMGQYIEHYMDQLIVLDEVDVEFTRWKRLIGIEKGLLSKLRAFYLYQRVKRFELKMVEKCDLLLTVTPNDRDTIKNFLPNADIVVIPTCVDISYFHPSERVTEGKNLIFVGSLGHLPNVDGILYFCRDVFPYLLNESPDTHLFIVGVYPPPEVLQLKGKNITVTGYVEDIRPYIYQSQVFIAPLRFGSGIKGKILEAMAMGIPVVTSSIGIEGIDCVANRDLIVAEGSRQMAEEILNLLKSLSQRKLLRENALSLVREKYQWEPAIFHLEEALQHRLERGRALLQ